MADETVPAERKPAKYVVLAGASTDAETWQIVGTFEGLTRRAVLAAAVPVVQDRLRQAAERNPEAEAPDKLPSLVAVPARSFAPVNVTVGAPAVKIG